MSGYVEIFTDGACKGNPGPGGWEALLRWGDTEKELFGGEEETTNNRMELLAVVEALEALKRPVHVTVTTDSKYVKNGFTQWMPKWKHNGWVTANKKPVKNKDLWIRLDTASIPHKVSLVWVKGHSGDPGNERADQLANDGVSLILNPF